MISLTKIWDDVVSRQVSSYDTSGGNRDCAVAIPDGSTFTLMDVQGAGMINHIWITIAPMADELSRNDIVIRMYWDGNAFPSVESPFPSHPVKGNPMCAISPCLLAMALK